MRWDIEIALEVMYKGIEWTGGMYTTRHADIRPFSICGLCPRDVECSTTYVIRIEY